MNAIARSLALTTLGILRRPTEWAGRSFKFSLLACLAVLVTFNCVSQPAVAICICPAAQNDPFEDDVEEDAEAKPQPAEAQENDQRPIPVKRAIQEPDQKQDQESNDDDSKEDDPAANNNAAANSEKAKSVPNVKKKRPKSFERPAIIQFHGQIDRKLFLYFKSRLARAKRDGVDLLIIEVDSPGGLLEESQDMAIALRNVDWAYTVAFVPNEAISGGALVSLGVDEIITSPNAKFGDVGIIAFDTQLWAYRFVEPKIESYLVSQIRDLCESKGRPPELGEAMVDKEVMVYTRPDKDGNNEFKKARVGDENLPKAPWLLVEESGAERFLTLSGSRCRTLGIAEGLGDDRTDLADRIGFDLKRAKVYEYGLADNLVYYLNHPLITGLLITLGLIALYVELSAPGIGLGGTLAGVCAMLFFWSRFLSGTSGWLEVILFVAGLAFLAIELFVIPGWGVSGVLGLLFLLVSVVMASQNFVLPTTNQEWNTTLTSLTMILSSFALVFVAAIFITKKFGSLPVFNQMVLAPSVESKGEESKSADKKIAPLSHPVVSVGDWGMAESLLRPAGRALFNGRSVDVVSDGSFIEQGTQIRIVKMVGNIVTVAKVHDEMDG